MIFKILLLCFIMKLVSCSRYTRDDAEERYCYNKSVSNLHNQFATKTAYAMIKENHLGNHPVGGCVPEKIWLLSRYGAIHPSKSIMDKLSALVEIRDATVELSPEHPELCTEDVDLLKSWNWDENKTPDVLANQGWTELQTLATEFKNAFEDLFESPGNTLFRHTSEQWIKDSFKAFAEALFGVGVDDNIKVDDSGDMLLKFYERCDKWKGNRANLNDSESDLSKFEKSNLYTKTIGEISKRLGLSESDYLPAEEVTLIWDMCRYDKAWNNTNPSPWCSLFEEEHINVLEYHEDLKLYYQTGHGFEMNSRLACSAVADLIEHFENVNDTLPKVIVSFAHATTIQLFLTALGTHKDNLVPSTSSIDEMSNRKWKSSEISPFASNLAVVKYNCTNEEHQVKFFLNQKPLVPDWCIDDVCKFKDFTEAYSVYAEADCTDYFCSEDSGAVKAVYGALAVFVNLILIYLY